MDKLVKGGAGAAEWGLGVYGGVGQQTSVSGENMGMIAIKHGGSRRRKSSRSSKRKSVSFSRRNGRKNRRTRR